MILSDLALQVAADALALRELRDDEPIGFVRTGVIGEQRVARARLFLKYLSSDDTLDDVEAVALRLLPLLKEHVDPQDGPRLRS